MASSLSDWWPLRDLTLEIGHLSLGWADDEALGDLAALVARGVHPPEYMPFSRPWTDAEPAVRAQRIVSWIWGTRARSTPESWKLALCVRADGEVVGVMSLHADDFAIKREIYTGSFLGLDYQSRGIGKAMRVAALSFAFDHLEATWVTGQLFEDNHASRAVIESSGYAQDGFELAVRRGQSAKLLRYRISRDQWASQGQGKAVSVVGFEECRAWFGMVQ